MICYRLFVFEMIVDIICLQVETNVLKTLLEDRLAKGLTELEFVMHRLSVDFCCWFILLLFECHIKSTAHFPYSTVLKNVHSHSQK